MQYTLPSAQSRYSMWVFWLQTSMLYNLGMWHINNSCLSDFKHFTYQYFFTVTSSENGVSVLIASVYHHVLKYMLTKCVFILFLFSRGSVKRH